MLLLFRHMVQLGSAIPFIGILGILWSQRVGANLMPQQYVFISVSLSWHEAQRFCRVKFTDLATVNNMADKNKLVHTLGGRVTHTWIGLHRGASDRWMWTDGSGTASFTRWNDGEPNQATADERCGELSSTGKWNDNPCGDEKEFVCYERQHNGEQKLVFYSEKKSWEESLELCRDKHTDMVDVRTEEENSEIVDMIKTWLGFFGVQKTVWIGLFRDSWIWSDGSKTSFRFWLRGASNGGNCGSVAGNLQGRWVASNCNQKAMFVCQGGLKVKKMVIRMKVHSDADLTASKISDALLKKWETNLKLQHVTDFKLSWRSEKRGLVFQPYEEQEVVLKTGC